MMLPKPLKVLLLALTLWPIVYVIGFTVMIMTLSGGAFETLFLVHGLTMMLIMGLLAFYVIDVFKTARVDKDKKVLWALALFMGGLVAMPIYFFVYIWPETPPIARHG